MIQSICFMQTDGMYITGQIANLLYENAITLAQTGQKLMRFKVGDVAEGVLTTQFNTAVLVDHAGIKFTARVENETRTFNVSFIIDERYLKEVTPGIWVRYFTEPDSIDAKQLN